MNVIIGADCEFTHTISLIQSHTLITHSTTLCNTCTYVICSPDFSVTEGVAGSSDNFRVLRDTVIYCHEKYNRLSAYILDYHWERTTRNSMLFGTSQVPATRHIIQSKSVRGKWQTMKWPRVFTSTSVDDRY